MIAYFIKVVALQLLFLLSYDLFLKKETFFNWNRFYLISSSIISFVLPLVKIESFQNAVPQEFVVFLPAIVLTPEKTTAAIEPTWNWFFSIGIAISCALFLYKIVQLLRLRFKGNIVKRENYTIVIIPNSTLAFSIFRYVFIGENIQEEKLEDILSHELVHIREKHSLDLLYFEVLRILCWFNPFIYIYQKRISEIHEYIADAEIVKHKSKSDYYDKLLSEVFQTQQFSFTNQFFKHSLIKKRISMLAKQKSREILKLKYLVLIPLVLMSLVYSSCEDSNVSETEELQTSSKTMQKEGMSKEFQTEEVTFMTLEKAPVFPGCEGLETLEAKKQCFTREISTHVANNFNAKKASELNLTGKQKIFVSFVIDTDGSITNIQTQAPHPALAEEAEQVIRSLPNLTPGVKDGKSVRVKYVLPIVFAVNE